MSAAPVTGPRLYFEGVTVAFGALKAMDDVSFSVGSGEIHAVIGPNGAGKSSLLNALSGIYRPDSGRIVLDGEDLTRLGPAQVCRLGVARTFQNIVVSPHETVLDNLLVSRHSLTRAGVLRTALRLSRREERRHEERIREIASFVGIQQLLHRRASELSYGDLKRVELARALGLEPRLLVLDEPVAGLNSIESLRLAGVVAQARDALGLTVIFVEHDMGVVMSIADRVTVLDFGQVVAHGTAEEVRRDPEVIRAYLGDERDAPSNPTGVPIP
jgi:branched-chain amino acid transport system ATP-binding protein